MQLDPSEPLISLASVAWAGLQDRELGPWEDAQSVT